MLSLGFLNWKNREIIKVGKTSNKYNILIIQENKNQMYEIKKGTYKLVHGREVNIY